MIYDDLYTDETYNLPNTFRINKVYEWVKNYKSILDVGCGQGNYLKHMDDKGLNVSGIELSQEACSKLKGYKVVNIDLLHYKGKYDALYCMDVLEHIEPTEIDDNLKNLASIAPHALLGIANHSDVCRGVELHLIQENAEWWWELLSKYYKKVELSWIEDRFFAFECSL